MGERRDACPTGRAAAVDISSLPLRDQHGESITLRALEGRTLVLNFIFTHCIVACHTQVKSLNSVRASLPSDIRPRVQFLSISLDPAFYRPYPNGGNFGYASSASFYNQFGITFGLGPGDVPVK